MYRWHWDANVAADIKRCSSLAAEQSRVHELPNQLAIQTPKLQNARTLAWYIDVAMTVTASVQHLVWRQAIVLLLATGAFDYPWRLTILVTRKVYG